MASLADAQAAQEEIQRLLVGVPGVNGIGIGRERSGYVVRVYVESGSQRPQTLPAVIHETPIVIETIGQIWAQ